MCYLTAKLFKYFVLLVCALNIVFIIVLLSNTSKWNSPDNISSGYVLSPTPPTAKPHLLPSPYEAQTQNGRLQRLPSNNSQKPSMDEFGSMNENAEKVRNKRGAEKTTTTKLLMNEKYDRFELDSKGVVIIGRNNIVHAATPHPRVTMPLFQALPVTPEG
nr:uncharacterized protein LOC128669329 [Plodia interpunctella]